MKPAPPVTRMRVVTSSLRPSPPSAREAAGGLLALQPHHVGDGPDVRQLDGKTELLVLFYVVVGLDDFADEAAALHVVAHLARGLDQVLAQDVVVRGALQ